MTGTQALEIRSHGAGIKTKLNDQAPRQRVQYPQMKVRYCILFLLISFYSNGLKAQFEYFNLVQGIEGDNSSQTSVDIEVVDDTYVIWGGGVDNGGSYFYLRLLDLSGDELTEISFERPGELLYLGSGGSLSYDMNSHDYWLSRHIVDTVGSHGILFKASESLDTTWSRKYQFYGGYTSFITHCLDEDAIIVAGDYGSAPGQRGTFIAKIDTAGEVLWHQSIHAPEEGAFRNTQISVLGENIVVTGGEIVNSLTIGYLEILTSSGQLIWHQEGLGAAIRRSAMVHTISEDSELFCLQPIAYEDVPGVSNPIWTYNKMRLYQADIELEELIIIGDYLEEEGWVRGGPIKCISVANGLVFIGGFFESATNNLVKGFIGKLNDSYELDWYTELFYDDCSSCTNQLYDLEVAPDGGYVMVGKFDSQEDPYDKTWLVKVDACGDLEWQGCELPDGLWDTSAPLSGPLRLYPNPASDFVRVVAPSGVGGSAGWPLQTALTFCVSIHDLYEIEVTLR